MNLFLILFFGCPIFSQVILLSMYGLYFYFEAFFILMLNIFQETLVDQVGVYHPFLVEVIAGRP